MNFLRQIRLGEFSSHPTTFVKSLNTTLPKVAQGSPAGSSQIKYRGRTGNTAALKYKIHWNCIKLTWAMGNLRLSRFGNRRP